VGEGERERVGLGDCDAVGEGTPGHPIVFSAKIQYELLVVPSTLPMIELAYDDWKEAAEKTQLLTSIFNDSAYKSLLSVLLLKMQWSTDKRLVALRVRITP
jgi:hypothetical protein